VLHHGFEHSDRTRARQLASSPSGAPGTGYSRMNSVLAHRVVLAPFCVWRLPVEADTSYSAAPVSDGVALYLAAKRPLRPSPQKRSRPIRVTIAPPRNIGNTRYARPRRKQSGLEPLSRFLLAPWQPHQLISGRAPSGSYQNSCILVQLGSKMGWDSSLVRLIRPTRHPQSHIRPGLAGSVGQTHSPDQVVTMAPVGTLAVFRRIARRAITSLRASAVIMMRRTRPLRSQRGYSTRATVRSSIGT